MLLSEFAFRIALAIILGFSIGLERQLTGHMAGIRTNVLVALGAAMFVMFSHLSTTTDMTRIAAQVVTGVGFLCSGIIFKEGLNVKGLNTAATLWCSAAIGVLSTTGMAYHAIIATVMLIVSNLLLRIISDRLPSYSSKDDEGHTYMITIFCDESEEFNIRSSMMESIKTNDKLLLVDLESADVIGDKVEIEATIQTNGKRKDEMIEKIVSGIAGEKGISKVGWNLE